MMHKGSVFCCCLKMIQLENMFRFVSLTSFLLFPPYFLKRKESWLRNWNESTRVNSISIFTLKRKCLRWSGPMSATCSKSGGSHRRLTHSSCKMDTGCLPVDKANNEKSNVPILIWLGSSRMIPWKSWMSLQVLVDLLGAISSLDSRPFLSILMSSDKGSRVPSLLRPSPSPGCQPIFWRSLIPTLPAATGAALANWSFLTQAYDDEKLGISNRFDILVILKSWKWFSFLRSQFVLNWIRNE